MGVERQNFKNGGGYVGGFLHLFDWNAKSRKKLFSRESDLPDQSKQKKRNDGNFPMTRLHLMDQNDSLAGSSMKGSSDYSCASSVTDEEVGGSKAPGVVAKLMGLDSLPTSNFSEAYSTSFFDSQSIRNARYLKKNPDFHLDHQIMHSGNLHNKTEDPVNNNIEAKPQKVSRPIEKFQTEILPPKLAKSISITHHKLLSPIKSSGFVSSKNVVHIMEAAAKIIESGHQVTTKSKMSLVGSSVPLKVIDLKEKVEAAKKPSKLAEASQKQAESIAAAKHIKEQSMNKSWNGSLDTKSFKVFSELEDYSAGLKKKGKSISLAVQAKANVQRRKGLNPSNGSINTFGQKEQNDVMSSQFFKSQPSTQKSQSSTQKSQPSKQKSQPITQRSSYKKPSTNNAPNVLKQNNKKQNCLAESGMLPSKSLTSTNSQGRKMLDGDSSLVRQRNSGKNSGNTKVGSRKLGFEVTDDGNEVPNSSATSVTRKKRCIDGDINFQKNQVSNVDNNGKAIQSNGLMMDRQYSWAEDSKRNGMDVVSFTFTAPMARSVPAPETSREVIKKNKAFCANFQGENMLFNSGGTTGSRASSICCNLIGGEALSTLLDQKLRELSVRTESSHHKAGTAGSFASIFQEIKPTLEAVTTSPDLHDKGSGKWPQTVNSDHRWGSVSSSNIYEGLIGYKLQGGEDIYECGSDDSEVRNLFDCRLPSPISILEPVFAESCNSSDTADTNSTEGSKHSSSVRAQDVFDIRTSKKFHFVEADTELSDSASSTRTVAGNHVTLAVIDSVGSTKWELEYVKMILCNTEMMFKDFACGRTCEIINTQLFDQLELRKAASECHEDEPKLQRKVLFDCVGECLDLRCGQYVGGGYRAWEKGLSVVRRKEWLAEEVHKEILGWEAMGDCMVDELVDKDMSSHCGRWLDFDVEAFELLGLEIEGRILNSLVNELIVDILLR